VTVWCTDRVSFDHVAWFEQSIAQWETTTSIDFVPRTTESDYVLIRNSQFNSSAIGHQGGVQIINMDVWDQIFVGAHELAHALGIYHEQSRPDRDNFVQINVANISTTACAGSCVPNFNIFGFAYPTYLSPIYDFDSVMHYRRGQFSGNGLDTITVLAPYNAEWQSQIGQRDHLSFWDVRVLEYLYPGGEIEFVWQESPNQNQEGSFLIPWKSLADGFAHAPSGGRLAILYPDVYTAQGVYSSPVLIEAPTGGVILQ